MVRLQEPDKAHRGGGGHHLGGRRRLHGADTTGDGDAARGTGTHSQRGVLRDASLRDIAAVIAAVVGLMPRLSVRLPW